MHAISLETRWTPIPKSLEYFVHDWICCEHTRGRWRWLDFFLFVVELKKKRLWEQTLLQIENGFTTLNMRPLILPNGGHFCLPVFHYPFIMVAQFALLDNVFKHFGRQTSCVCNNHEYEALHTENHYVWKETNVAFWECSIWHGSAV